MELTQWCVCSLWMVLMLQLPSNSNSDWIDCNIAEVDKDSIRLDSYTDSDDDHKLLANVSWDAPISQPGEQDYDGFWVRLALSPLEKPSTLFPSCYSTSDLTRLSSHGFEHTVTPFHIFEVDFGYTYNVMVFTYNTTTKRRPNQPSETNLQQPTLDCYETTGDLEFCQQSPIQVASNPVNAEITCVLPTEDDLNEIIYLHVRWNYPVQIEPNAYVRRFYVELIGDNTGKCSGGEHLAGADFYYLSEEEIAAARSSGSDVSFAINIIHSTPQEYVLRDEHATFTLEIETKVSNSTSGLDANGNEACVPVDLVTAPNCNVVWSPWSSCNCTEKNRTRVCMDEYGTGLKCDDALFQTGPCDCVLFSSTIIGAIVAGGALLLAVISALIWRFCCQSRCQEEYTENVPTETLIRDMPNSKDFGEFRKQVSPFEEYEITREDLGVHLDRLLGSGAQGSVYKGKLMRNKEWIDVAVKTPKFGDMTSSPVNENARAGFMGEIQFSIDVQGKKGHPNILEVLGCCTTHEPYYLVTPFMKYGDLLGFVRKCSKFKVEPNTDDPTYNLGATSQLNIMRQVAKGMEFLSGNRYYMGDLAASNVLVGDHLVAKIADFGLGYDLYSSSDGNIERQQDAPFKFRPRWVALETYESGGAVCNLKSDVWSFGVLMYEVYTYGELPYSQKWSNAYLLKQLKNGYRLEQPDCPDNVYEVMRECWNRDPNERPSFSDLVAKLNSLLIGLTRKSSEALGYIDAIGSFDGGLQNPAFDDITEEDEEEKDPRYVTKLPVASKPRPESAVMEGDPNLDDPTYLEPMISSPDQDVGDTGRINLAARDVVTMTAAGSDQIDSSSGLPNSEQIDINDFHSFKRQPDVNETSSSHADSRF